MFQTDRDYLKTTQKAFYALRAIVNNEPEAMSLHEYDQNVSPSEGSTVPRSPSPFLCAPMTLHDLRRAGTPPINTTSDEACERYRSHVV